MFKFCFIFLVFITLGLSNAQSEGVACTENGKAGVCKLLGNCPEGLARLISGVFPKTCGFEGTQPIVCCNMEFDSRTNFVTTTPPTPSTEFVEPKKESYVSTPRLCPPLPENALGTNVTKTGQKAWDKCIELAEVVYPCEEEISYTLRSTKTMIRNNMCSNIATTHIIGGEPTQPGEYPHVAMIGFGTNDTDQILWACGGSLISNRWVLTAAHCTFHRAAGGVKSVRLGGKDRNIIAEEGELFPVIQVILHPYYSSMKQYNDIALLQLNRNVPFSKTIRPACLHTGEPLENTMFDAIGWGTTEHGSTSDNLLRVQLELFEHDECSRMNPQSRTMNEGIRESTQLCAGNRKEKKDTCQGDSGGPLLSFNDKVVHCTQLIVGIVSKGRSCGVIGQPAIYTRVSAFIPWIENIVWPD